MVPQHRIHALDAVRAFALLTGILLHETLSFIGSYPVQDSSPSMMLGVTAYVIYIFRMSLFFMMAGFFAHMVLHRRGTRAFVKDRSTRILVPMVGGWFIFGTLTIVVMHWGGRRTSGGVPLLHFWFLYYLSIFYVLALTLREAFDGLIDRDGRTRVAIDSVVRSMTSTYIAPIVLAAPLFVVLYFNDAWAVWWGIPAPSTSFMPNVSAMVGYGTAFGFGWFLHRQAELLGRWQAAWHVHLWIGIALTAVCLSIVGYAPGLTMVPGPAGSRVAYTGCYTVATWFWTFGIVGAGLRFCSQQSPLRRYLADSSYYLFLAHLPLVFFLQVVFAKVPLHWTVKFPLIFAIALTVLLVSYHYWVRPTFIGALLNGRKYPRRKVLGPAIGQKQLPPPSICLPPGGQMGPLTCASYSPHLYTSSSSELGRGLI